ncbi:hypothetical protein F9P76_04150 [Salmonella enterica subsp. diarizonae]|nr:hypothetical protein [Salmonella enterica subsp. diarizonae]
MAKKTANAPYFDLILLNRRGYREKHYLPAPGHLDQKTALALFPHYHRQIKQFTTFFGQV